MGLWKSVSEERGLGKISVVVVDTPLYDKRLIFWQLGKCNNLFQLCMVTLQDIPDIEGDKIFGVRTFTVRVGQKKVGLKVNILFRVQERRWCLLTEQANDKRNSVSHCLLSECWSQFLVGLFFRFSGYALDYFRQHMHQLVSLVSHPRLLGAELLWYEMQVPLSSNCALV